jgi:hypothetical protein
MHPNTADFKFGYIDRDAPYEDGINPYGRKRYILCASRNSVEDIDFYVHEFSEFALSQAMKGMTRKYMHMNIKYPYFAPSSVAHLISPSGYPNKRTLFPESIPRKVYIQLKRRLSIEELEKRLIMGGNWDES